MVAAIVWGNSALRIVEVVKVDLMYGCFIGHHHQWLYSTIKGEYKASCILKEVNIEY